MLLSTTLVNEKILVSSSKLHPKFFSRGTCVFYRADFNQKKQAFSQIFVKLHVLERLQISLSIV